MRKNTKQLLLWLYDPDNNQRWVQLQILLLLSNESSTNLRAVLRHLQSKELVIINSTDVNWSVSLTQYGRRYVKSLFPALQSVTSQSSKLSLVLFYDAPRSDQGFRYLRSFLLENGFFSVLRGVYGCPGEVPEKVQHLLNVQYAHSVLIAEADVHSNQPIDAMIRSNLQLSDVASLISGISKEVDQLIEIAEANNGLTNQHFTQIYSVIGRMVDLPADSVTWVKAYYPQVSSFSSLLSRIQSLS